jgi:hypothetical protein
MPTGDEAQEKARLIQDPRWALVERVGASPALQRAPRLRELFRYLCECAIRNPHVHVAEPQIGVAVFERSPGYDTNADTIVRVQVSQLRRKVEHHFLSDGKDEPVVIELPKGSYLPVFRARPEPSSPARGAPKPEGAGWRRRSVGIALAAALCVATGLVASRPFRAASRAPHVEHFWRQFTDGRSTQVVLSDVGVTMLADLLGRPVVLKDYLERAYPAGLVAELTADANVKAALTQAAVKGFSNAQDAAVAHAAAVACDRQGPAAPTTLVSARYLKMDPGRPENLVFLGHRRANPWTELFDRTLNFTYRFDEVRRVASFDNHAPHAGEEKSYTVEWGRRGHCLVAYLPKPRGEGSVLLIAGTDWLSGSAGGQFLTDEGSMVGLHQRLGAGLSARLPYFEALVQAELTGSVTTSYRLVAHRVIAPEPPADAP